MHRSIRLKVIVHFIMVLSCVADKERGPVEEESNLSRKRKKSSQKHETPSKKKRRK